MRLRNVERRQSGEENVIPLINVVFLMLIFFMLAGRISENDAFPVTPPESETQAIPDWQAREILIDAQGNLAVDGRRLSLDDLQSELAISPPPDRPVAVNLKVDEHLMAADFMPVLAALRDSGLTRVTLLTTAKR